MLKLLILKEEDILNKMNKDSKSRVMSCKYQVKQCFKNICIKIKETREHYFNDLHLDLIFSLNLNTRSKRIHMKEYIE